MSNYTQLLNNFDSIGLLTFRDSIDLIIDQINSGDITLVDGLLEMTKKEIAFKQERVNKSMIKTAHFPFIKTFEDYDFSFQPRINKEEIMDLKNLRFIENNENIVFVGSPGVGKTHLAVALGIETSKNRYQTYFINANDLIGQLRKAKNKKL